MLKENFEYMVVKLISGEEVFGKVEDSSETKIILSKPHMIVQTPDGLALAPYLQTGEDKVTFYSTSVVALSSLNPDLISEYDKAIKPASGIIMPDELKIQV